MDDQRTGHNIADIEAYGLKKHNIKTSTVVFMIFSLVAAGCYGIEEMIPESGPGLTLLMLIIIPLVWSTPFALVAAELGSARPQEGGYYKWVQEALGEYWGFQACWWRTIGVYIDNTLYVILAGGYLAGYFNLSSTYEMIAKMAMIIIFTYINIRGVRDVGFISTILSILVIVAFSMVAICGFLNWNSNPFEPFVASGEISMSELAFGDWIYYIGMSIAIGLWMYSGYESMSTIAGEVENPQVIPKATLITVPLIMAIYIVPTMAGLASIGNWESWGTDVGDAGYADVVTTYWGTGFGLFFVIVAVLANCSIYNTYIASGSRGFFALADDNLAPRFLVKCDKKHGVPYVTVLTIAITNMILCNFAFTTIVIVDVFLLISSYILIFISAIVLRKKIPDEERPFKIPGGFALLCLICIIPCILASCSFFINGTDYFIGGMIGITSGPIMYIICKRKYGGLTKKNSLKFPMNPKTGLASGDLKRISFTLFIVAIMGGLAWPWLMWFEGDWWGQWGPEYYLVKYSSGFLSDFYAMLNAIKFAAILFAVIAAITFLMSRVMEPKEKKN